MRVGVVGVGNMGFHHARIYSELSKEGKVELVGISDIDFPRAKDVANQFKTRAFKNYKELLDLVDAVSVAVPTSLHYEVAIDFLKAGIHVLVEKPIAESIEKAEGMIKEAEKNKVVLMVGHVERFNPAVLKLKEVVSRKEIGEIITMSARRVGPFNPKVSETNVIIDLAIHDIDIMVFLTNSRVREIYATSKKIIGGSDDYAIILIKFKNNSEGVIETNRLTPKKIRDLTILGSDGVVWLEYMSQKLLLGKKNDLKEIEVSRKEPLRVEIEHFLESIEKNCEPITNGDVGTYALKIALKALESAIKNEIVRVEKNEDIRIEKR